VQIESNDTQVNFSVEFGCCGNYTYNCLGYDNSSNSAWGNNVSFKINYTAPDLDAPYIFNLTNESTTQTSSFITFDLNETGNYTIKLYDDVARTSLIDSIFNNTFTTYHNPYFDSLVTGTTYYVNLTTCDISGNCRDNNTFDFMTQAAEAEPFFITIDFSDLYNGTLPDGYCFRLFQGVKCFDINGWI
jgi:hypothetical protein